MPATIRSRFKIVYLVFILIFACAAISLIYISSLDYYNYNNSLSTYNKLGQYTKLIHVLQKERGLSSIYIHNCSTSSRSSLEKGRMTTTDYINSSSIEEFNTIQNSIEFIRTSMDNNLDNAEYIILEYSKLIYMLISKINSQALLANKKYSQAFLQLQNLIMAREHLGRLRAYISTPIDNMRQDRLSKTYALERYIFYTIAINEFFSSQSNKHAIHQFESTTTLEVLKKIEDLLKGNAATDFDNAEAFAALTKIIDYYFDIETSLLANIEEDLRADKSKMQFFFFTITAVSLAFIFLSAFIIFKYLSSLTTRLAKLHETMSLVLKTKNYQVTCYAEQQDEISAIARGLNTLLQFTHQLIVEKDAMASHDQLTEIYNRNKFIELFTLEMNKSIRYNTPFCIVMMDIDHFKKINDTHGHGVGDTVLKELANLVMQHIRASDILARWGGEEFVLLAPSSTLETTRDLAEKLRQLIAAHLFAGHLKITMSFGIAQYAPNDTLKSIIARADSALYISKHEGRNKVTCA